MLPMLNPQNQALRKRMCDAKCLLTSDCTDAAETILPRKAVLRVWEGWCLEVKSGSVDNVLLL